MISDQDSSDDSSDSDRRHAGQQRRSKKRRRKIGPNTAEKSDKKRRTNDHRLEDLKLEQSQLIGAAVPSRTQVVFPPTLASLLTPHPNRLLPYDPSFFNPGAEPLRRWMHLTRTPGFATQPQIVDPFALGVAGLPNLPINQPSLLPGLPYFSGVGAGTASLSNPTIADLLNLVQQAPPPARAMDAGLRRDLSLVAAAQGWNALPFSQPNLNMIEQTRRFLERAPISMEELGRRGSISLQESIPMRNSGENVLATLANVQQAQASSRAATAPSHDSLLLSIPDDEAKLNEQQVFLRRQIEVFRATEDDILSHTRGRNKPISLGQAGVRCRHCGHLPVSKRRKGSTYFPSSLIGIYQAAQNLGVEHLFTLVCPELPPDVNAQAAAYANKKFAASIAGKPYWAESGKKLGLVDTEHGIRFAEDMDRPEG